ncbi:MAG: type sorting protein [Ferruginibacter sp.]|nr:type sorting protein [Ferruginibacter sp.]
MKRILFALLLLISFNGFSQTTFYWVGGTTLSSFTSNSNWNTSLDGSGAFRTAAAATDVLIFSGDNIGGGTPTTGVVSTNITTTTAGQIKLINNANVVFQRPAAGGGTGTITIAGGTGEDFQVDNGSSLSMNIVAADGTIVIALAPGATGRVAGTISLANSAHRIVSQTTGALVFAAGANVSTNTTNYPFGSTSSTPIAVEKGVVFESGASLIYLGGNSPMGNSSTFSAIDFRSGSNYYLRSAPGTGSFLNAKIFGNLFLENSTTFTTDGPISKIDNFTIGAGSTFTVHTSGSTVVTGNVLVDGILKTPAAASTNVLVMAGLAPQTISGTGTITLPGFTVADRAQVSLAKSLVINSATNVFGKLNFNGNQLSGTGTFTSRVNNTAATVIGNLTAGGYQVTGVTGTLTGITGLQISGTGIAPNTAVVAFSTTGTINLSQPMTASGTAVTLTFSSDTATLATAHSSGLDSLNGSVVVSNTKNFQSGTNYIINAATSWPFGITSGSTNTTINAGFVEINAATVLNRNITLFNHLMLNAKLTARPLDTVHVNAGAVINGNIGSTNYIVTSVNPATGALGALQYDGISSSVLLPVGTTNYYLPATVTPTTTSSFVASVFEGITSNGTVLGTPLSAAQKQSVVNAVWLVNRISGSGASGLQIQWNPALEGSTFTTLPGTDIGLIYNTGSSYALPVGTGNNTTNTVQATVTAFGAFSAGAIPSTQPFIFNAIPTKTYGDPDFNAGASSLNTTQPILYSSSNPLVATIVAGNIHITGAGTTDITASQVSDGFYPGASITRTLTVNKATLTISADNKTKFESEAVPPLTFTYSGFVYGETAAVLINPVAITTTATIASVPGAYPITVSSASALNYTIVYVNAVMTVLPRQNQTITFAALPVKTYGNADFAAGATTTNLTIPIIYTSSNTAVATIIGNNIHITGAGTTNITASQAGSIGYFPATSVIRALTVNKAPLTIRVRDTSRLQGQDNPVFTLTYTGFVLGQTVADLTTPPVATTDATVSSSPGYYTVNALGATSSNYTITTVPGRLTVLPLSGNTALYMLLYQPNANTLNARLFSPKPNLADIVLYDLNGRQLQQKNVFLPAGFITSSLFINNIPSGVYIVRVKGDGIDLKQLVRIIR